MPPVRLSPHANRALLAIGVFTFASWTFAAALLLAWAPARAAAHRTVSRVAEAWPLGRVQATRSAPAGPLAPLALDGSLFSPPVLDRVALVPLVSAAGVHSEAFSYGDDESEDGFSWSITGEPDVHDNARQARFRFRENGADYVVRDPALVAEAQRAAAPLTEVGREMGQLGGEMGRHGAEMGRIGGQLGAASARLAAVQARLARRAARDASLDASRAQIDEMRTELDRLREELSEKQAAHAGRQRELSRRMSELSARHQEVLREVREQVREIARRALREGKAERPHANA